VHIDYKCIDSEDKRYARLDFVLELPHKRLILEVDERQHQDVAYEVSCDLARMMFVTSAIACSRNVRPTQWIRFNPNGFKVDEETVRVPKKRKYQQLLSVIQDTTEFSGVRISYMYYDVTNKMPTICMDSSYDPKVKEMLSAPIID
jgi:very-short-patch-repair endonuclease